MAGVQRKLVHMQFNSPMGLYSQQAVKETLHRELKAFGAEGIEVDDTITKPLNLANSAVLRAVEEEEQEMKNAFEMFTSSLATNKKTNERKSRSRQRFEERPHTPLHHQQLEQIKTQYLSHQHDITIDRDTVLKINRLATRRNLHKREHSWPPETPTANIASTDDAGDIDKGLDDGPISCHPSRGKKQWEHHVRSTSTDNALQFDDRVCKRHGIDVIREKFNSPTRIIEPTAVEMRLQRQRQQQQHHQKQHHQTQSQRCSNVGSSVKENTKTSNQENKNGAKHPHEGTQSHNESGKANVTKNSNPTEGELINKGKEEPMRNVKPNTPEISENDNKLNSKEASTKHILEQREQAHLGEMGGKEEQASEDDTTYQATNLPKAKGFSHPETKAADEDIGLVEPKRQFYEQLTSCKKWFSYENLHSASQTTKPINSQRQQQPYNAANHLHHHHPKRQSYSLERGRDTSKHMKRQLPPQKPRNATADSVEPKSPKLQRRSIKMATEIKICYDADAEEHETQVKSLHHPLPVVKTEDGLENIPLPKPPTSETRLMTKGHHKSPQKDGETHQTHLIPISLESPPKTNNSEQLLSSKSSKESQMYDDACIYLRSIDLQDNTVAYIPAAITIVPSPSEETIQQWMESGQLKANIQNQQQQQQNEKEICQDMASNESWEAANHSNLNEDLRPRFKPESMKSSPEAIKQQKEQEQISKSPSHMKQQANGYKASGSTQEPETYVTRLPSTPNGIQLTRQTSVNTKRKSQLNNSSNGSSTTTTNDTSGAKASDDASVMPTKAPSSSSSSSPLTTPQGVIYTNASTTATAGPGTVGEDNTVNSTIPSEDHADVSNSSTSGNNASQTSQPLPTSPPTESDKTQKGIYYTDGEYLYGPYDPTNGMPLARISIEEIQSSQRANQSKSQIQQERKHQENPQHHSEDQQKSLPVPGPPASASHRIEAGIKNDIEAEAIERNQHENEIANLTAKYEHIQKSISEHLRQIDAYIENAKTALKYSLLGGTAAHTSVDISAPTPAEAFANNTMKMMETHNLHSWQSNETPLQEILRKISHIMQDVQQQHELQPQPLSNQDQSAMQSKATSPIETKNINNMTGETAIINSIGMPPSTSSSQNGQENTAIVDKVLMDLNKLTEHLKEYDEADIIANHKSLQPLMDNLRQIQPLEIKFETRPSVQSVSYITAEDDGKEEKDVKTVAKEPRKEKHNEKQSQAKWSPSHRNSHGQPESQPKPTSIPDVVANYELLNSSNAKPITPSQIRNADRPKIVGKTVVADFITAHHQQEQLVGQVIDTLDKCNSSTTSTIEDHRHKVNNRDNKCGADEANNPKSNLNQTAPSSSSPTTGQNKKKTASNQNPNKMAKNATLDQQCNGPNQALQSASLHSRRSSGGGRRNESHLKLVIKNSRGIMADKQFSKYDKQVMNSKAQTGHRSQPKGSQNLESKKPLVIDKQLNQCHHPKKDEEEEESSSGGDIFKSSYELPSPYVMERQISWEEVSEGGQPPIRQKMASGKIAEATAQAIDSTNKMTGIGELQLMKGNVKSPNGDVIDKVTTADMEKCRSGHVEMQSTVPSKSSRTQSKPHSARTQSMTPPPPPPPPLPANGEKHTRRYPASLIEPHIPKRASSPFGLNAVAANITECVRQRASSPQDNRCLTPNPTSESQAIRKCPKALVAPSAATKGEHLNSVDLNDSSRQRSVSISPTPAIGSNKTTKTSSKRTSPGLNEETCEPLRKYPAPLVEPPTPTRSNSPFGLNSVVVPLPPPPPPLPIPTYSAKQRSVSISPTRRIDRNKKSITYSTRASPTYSDEMEEPLRKYPAPLVEPLPPTRSNSPFGLNAVVCPLSQLPLPPPPEFEDCATSDNFSPIRKYPSALIEPHVPSRSASPFGLNVLQHDTWSSNRARTPSPARGHKKINKTSCHNKPSKMTYVPQVEGHNVGLLVQTAITPPASVLNHAIVIDTPAKTQTNSEADTKNPHFDTNAQVNFDDADADVADCDGDDEDDDVTSYELQHINTNDITKETAIMKNTNDVCNMDATDTSCNSAKYNEATTMTSNWPTATTDNQLFQELYDEYCHATAEMTPPSTSVINRSFDNVSPRPYISIEGYKRVAWPPANEERVVREFTPQPHGQYAAPTYNPQAQEQQHQQQPPQSQQYQPSAAPPTQQQQYQQQQQQYQPPKQYSPQPQYQASAPGQNQYQYQPQQQQQPHHQPWTQEQHLPQPYKPPSQQGQYQAPQQPSPYQQQQYQQPGYQAPMNNQYQQPQQQQQQQQNQFISQTNQQQQFNSYSQPQQMQNAPIHGQDQHDHLIQGHDQRGASPGIITLRKEAPISQAPAPVYTSQPAAVSFQGGNKLRGDMKWPPQEYKEAAARENEERRKLALGPVCRPRKVARDYTDFFAKNALSHHYPSYKVPPGTQHMTY
ncbi:uncharacterized protein LOC142236755 isoform X2 [Haematobia irritans]|uniref:uncharacterized protein LOC142236755 isoform X2 n=1 Tax=Haematobia irritans TaxID=7368 RepID=UPI003F501A61